MRLLAIVNLLVGGLAVRARKRASGRAGAGAASGGWSTSATDSRGPCADHMAGGTGFWPRPITFPLLCGYYTTDAVLSVTTINGWHKNLTIWVDGQHKVTTLMERPGTVRVTLGKMSLGLHTVGVYGGDWEAAITVWDVTVVGLNTACSFDTAPGFAWGADQSYTNKGFDVLNRLFGPSADFSRFRKEQLYFASQTVGKMDDRSIDATVVGDGVWQWMYQYSQQQAPGDAWNRKKMYAESDITPYPKVDLDYLPRHGGQKMNVQEPCNTLSNLVYHQAAVWVSCKGYPFERDELASVVAAFNGLAAGSAFMHASATNTGGMVDTFSMDWLMLQIYQITVSQVVSDAGNRLTSAERSAILNFGSGIGKATDVAKDMTRLFGEKYDHAHWNETVKALDAAIPDYTMPIAGLISFALWALQGKVGHGTDVILQEVLNLVMDAFGIPDAEFFTDVYTPAIRKALGFSKLCDDAIGPVLEYTLKFILTFVEALVYQEEQLDVPDGIRDVLAFLEQHGLSSSLYSDMVDSWDLYNGFDCDARSDHAIWHVKAGHGLVHFLNVAEYFRTHVGC